MQVDKDVIAITLFCVRSNLLVYEQKIANYISSFLQIASHAKKRGRNDSTHDFYFSKNSNNNLTPKAVPALCGANSVSPKAVPAMSRWAQFWWFSVKTSKNFVAEIAPAIGLPE